MQEKSSSVRVVVAVVLSIAILIVWDFFLGPKHHRSPPATAPQQTETIPSASDGRQRPARDVASPAQPEAAASGLADEIGTPLGEKSATPVRGPVLDGRQGETITLEHPTADVVLTSHGGTLRHWRLRDPRYQEADRHGTLRPIDLVQTQPEQGAWPLQTTFPQSDFELPPDAAFSLVSQTADRAHYQWESETVRVSKHYRLDRERPLLWLTLQVENLSQRILNQRLKVTLFGRQDEYRRDAGMTNPYPRIPAGLCLVNGEMERRSVGQITGRVSGCSGAGCSTASGPLAQTGIVKWIGSDYVYFLTALIPQGEQSYTAEERRCDISLTVEDPQTIETSLLYPERRLLPGALVEERFAVFAGAKDLSLMDSVVGMGGEPSELGEAIEFGWVAVLCRPMLWLMKKAYAVVGNWGLAIILLTLVVKLLTLYWTHKSMRSMKEMQRLKPKMDVLRQKYKNDKQRLNQEMMSLYKQHKVNPLGGCLPMLIQLPIWFALYRTLGTAQELYRSGFLGWITDLTSPDPYFILPIAMGAAMYAQQAITPMPMDATQAKMMRYVMPGMFTVMMLWLPSGLTLYIFTNTILTMLHQWHMNRTDPHRQGKTSPEVGEKASPGKAAESPPGSKAGQGNGQRKGKGDGRGDTSSSNLRARGKRRRRASRRLPTDRV